MKVWTFALRYAEDNVWEQSKAPIEIDLPDKTLEELRFGEKPVIELALTHTRSILLLFNNEESANTYMEGFKFGRTIQDDGDAVWQYRLDSYIDAALSGKEHLGENGSVGYEI